MKKKVKPHNFVNIFGWMLDLGLSSNELIVYALIFGFSQDDESEFQGSITYIQEWIGANSKHTAINAIKKLEEKGLVKKEQYSVNGVTFNKFKHIIPEGIEVVQLMHKGSAENAQEVVQKMHYGGSAENAPNINNSINSRYTPINTKDKNINNDINNITPPTPQGVCEWSAEEETFEQFRKAYKGSKRGHDVEFKDFTTKHKDWKEVIAFLLPAYERQESIREQQLKETGWRPQQKNLKTYLNQRCWEEEVTYEHSSKTQPNNSSDAIDRVRQKALANLRASGVDLGF